MHAWLERVRESQFFLAAIAAAGTGLVLFLRYPIPQGDPFLVLARVKAYPAYLFFVVTVRLFFFTTPLILYSAALSFFFVHLHRGGGTSAGGELPPYEPPDQRKDLYVILGERHHPTERKRVPNPTWITLPEKGLYTGMACFGAIGSGKTATFIRPVALQLFSYAAHDPERRLGGLVLEVKGDFCQQVRDMLRTVGRGEDYLEISLDTHYRYNPLANKDLDEDALAYAITTLIANIYGKGKDPFWPMASTNTMKFLVLLHRLVHDYVTLTDVYHAAINPGLLQDKLKLGRERYGVVEYADISADAFAEHTAKLTSHGFDEADTGYRATATPKLIEYLQKTSIPFTTTTIRQEGVDPERQAQFEAVDRWFKYDWSAIDVKLRTSIVEGISVFLSLFDTNPTIKRIFCPPKETFDPARNSGYALGEPFPPFADLIEQGKVVALNFPVSLNPIVAKTVGTLMKLDYQRAVLLRIPKMAAAAAAAEQGRVFRPTVFCVDEYQNFATVGETGTGDQNFFSLSRQPKCIGIVATQSIVSLKSALSSDDAYKTLLQTFRTKIFLNTADDVTAEFAVKLCGKEDRLQATYNVSESSQDAKVSFLDGRTAGGRTSVSTSKSYQVRQLERFPVKAFTSLKNAQAIVLAFDGVNPILPCYCYLKPHWLPVEMSWWDQYEKGLLEG
ncbi:MAG TPA: TraM recognition domain-containing protein [Vicinamibacteria bacterium]|jgi:hypothetical protein|nr:TraM recognition domain-containing protein [Vicinamibacteria bacterium]